VAKIDRLAQVEKQQIMSALPDYLRTKFNSALSTLTDDNKTAEDILLAFTSVNQELDDHGLPYYIIVFCPRWYIEAGIISLSRRTALDTKKPRKSTGTRQS
jgi:hypothetical protein